MDWLAPINTLIGAGIGVGSALLADRLRWRRDRISLSQDARRHAYAAFMGALSDAYQRLYETARVGSVADKTKAEAYEIFVASNLYPLRYQMVLIAPWTVVEPANQAFWKIRDMRDLVAAGAVVGSEEFRRLMREYIAAAEDTQVAMRRDLNTSWRRDESRSAGQSS